MPHVTVSFAQSLDGRIATSTGDSRWISCPESLAYSHQLRATNDAILIGINTALADDPELTTRLVDGPSPVRVVLDSTLRLPPTSRLAATAGEVPTLVFSAAATRASGVPGAPGAHEDPALPQRAADLTACGVIIETVPALAAEGRLALDIAAVLRRLDERGVRNLYVEGGSTVVTAFLRAGLVDRLCLVLAPLLIGEGTPAIGDLGVTALSSALEGRTICRRSLGRDLLWELSLPRNGGTRIDDA